jgi:hypothetical protein
MQFMLAEGEWGRVLMEMGTVFGLAFILLRVVLTGWILREAYQHAKQGFTLPLLLFGSCALNLMSGQIAQPTLLGFTTMGAGLCLVCRKGYEQKSPPVESKGVEDVPAANEKRFMFKRKGLSARPVIARKKKTLWHSKSRQPRDPFKP